MTFTVSLMHYVTKCSCGKIISQCRCPSKDKTVIVVPDGCDECKKRLTILDLGIESVKRFGEVALYGPLWLVEFRDYTQAIVLEDGSDDEPNYVLTADEI